MALQIAENDNYQKLNHKFTTTWFGTTAKTAHHKNDETTMKSLEPLSTEHKKNQDDVPEAHTNNTKTNGLSVSVTTLKQ